MVRGSRRDVHAVGVRRRCHQSADVAALRRLGVGVRLFPRDPRISGVPWQAGRLLQRQAQHLSCQRQGRGGGDGITQFGRALSALNIDIICANSPQAKGRVERAFGTLQDRLVKELRLAGISTIAAANAWLPGFIASHNERFGRTAGECQGFASAADRRQTISMRCWLGERSGRSRSNLTLHYDRMMLMLDPTPLARGLVRKKVEMVNYPDGRFAVQFDGTSLPFRVFDKIQTVHPGAIVENKRLWAALAGEARRTYTRPTAPASSGAATAAEQSRGARHAIEGTAVPRG